MHTASGWSWPVRRVLEDLSGPIVTLWLQVEFVWSSSDVIPAINHRSVYECSAAELERSCAGMNVAKTVYAGPYVEHALQQAWATA